MKQKIIPDIIPNQRIRTLPPEHKVFEAAKLMVSHDIGAIVITSEDGLMAGIVTERDLTRRVLAKGLDPTKISVGEIMTRDPDTVSPGDSALEALEIMRIRRYRHLPVVEDGKVVGMVSVRDLYEVMKEELEASIRETEAFVFGDRYGA
ncbi:MAG: CBS domain-containing protein [Rhodospirillales bacterium]|nr:CBS domain-containing protein [Rhodospirillales bacterium]